MCRRGHVSNFYFGCGGIPDTYPMAPCLDMSETTPCDPRVDVVCQLSGCDPVHSPSAPACPSLFPVAKKVVKNAQLHRGCYISTQNSKVRSSWYTAFYLYHSISICT